MHIDEANIEMLAKQIHNKKIRKTELDNHFQECDSCKNKLEFFISFYKNLEEEFGNPSDQNIKDFIKKIFMPGKKAFN